MTQFDLCIAALESFENECCDLYNDHIMVKMFGGSAMEAGFLENMGSKASSGLQKLAELAKRIWEFIKSVGRAIRDAATNLWKKITGGPKDVEAPEDKAEDMASDTDTVEKVVAEVVEVVDSVEKAVDEVEKKMYTEDDVITIDESGNVVVDLEAEAEVAARAAEEAAEKERKWKQEADERWERRKAEFEKRAEKVREKSRQMVRSRAEEEGKKIADALIKENIKEGTLNDKPGTLFKEIFDKDFGDRNSPPVLVITWRRYYGGKLDPNNFLDVAAFEEPVTSFDKDIESKISINAGLTELSKWTTVHELWQEGCTPPIMKALSIIQNAAVKRLAEYDRQIGEAYKAKDGGYVSKTIQNLSNAADLLADTYCINTFKGKTFAEVRYREWEAMNDKLRKEQGRVKYNPSDNSPEQEKIAKYEKMIQNMDLTNRHGNSSGMATYKDGKAFRHFLQKEIKDDAEVSRLHDMFIRKMNATTTEVADRKRAAKGESLQDESLDSIFDEIKAYRKKMYAAQRSENTKDMLRVMQDYKKYYQTLKNHPSEGVRDEAESLYVRMRNSIDDFIELHRMKNASDSFIVALEAAGETNGGRKRFDFGGLKNLWAKIFKRSQDGQKKSEGLTARINKIIANIKNSGKKPSGPLMQKISKCLSMLGRATRILTAPFRIIGGMLARLFQWGKEKLSNLAEKGAELKKRAQEKIRTKLGKERPQPVEYNGPSPMGGGNESFGPHADAKGYDVIDTFFGIAIF